MTTPLTPRWNARNSFGRYCGPHPVREAKMLSDQLIIEAIIVTSAAQPYTWETQPGREHWPWALSWDIKLVLEGRRDLIGDHPATVKAHEAGEIGWIPEKVLQAKLRGMYKRKIIDGCACGCRGDWELPIVRDPKTEADVPKWFGLVDREAATDYIRHRM